MVKVKKERRDSEAPEDGEQAETQTWEEKTRYLCAIAKPLATKKLTKRLLKTIKKGEKTVRNNLYCSSWLMLSKFVLSKLVQ